MLILYNATASFYAHNSFFFLLRQPLFTNTLLFSFYCDSLFLRTLFFFLSCSTNGIISNLLRPHTEEIRPAFLCLLLRQRKEPDLRSDPGMIGRRIPASAVTEMLPVR